MNLNQGYAVVMGVAAGGQTKNFWEWVAKTFWGWAAKNKFWVDGKFVFVLGWQNFWEGWQIIFSGGVAKNFGRWGGKKFYGWGDKQFYWGGVEKGFWGGGVKKNFLLPHPQIFFRSPALPDICIIYVN